MSFAITLRVSSTPRRAELLAVLDALAWANARWYLEEWDAGRKPPCCSACGSLRYAPDRPSGSVTMHGGTELLRLGVGSCGELAALEAGHARAKAMRNGEDTASAATAAYVDLELQSSARTSDGTREVWHAVVILRSGERVDPSVKVQAKASARAKVGA